MDFFAQSGLHKGDHFMKGLSTRVPPGEPQLNKSASDVGPGTTWNGEVLCYAEEDISDNLVLTHYKQH